MLQEADGYDRPVTRLRWQAHSPSVIVDLAGLEGIGYSGLSVLLRVRRWTRRSGGDLPLAAPQQPVRRILEATAPHCA
jgi:anti-anti-sigma factor